MVILKDVLESPGSRPDPDYQQTQTFPDPDFSWTPGSGSGSRVSRITGVRVRVFNYFGTLLTIFCQNDRFL